MTHPFSIYIWQPPQASVATGIWAEPLQADSEEFALYIANLIHQDSRAVIKVVSDGRTLASFPDEQTVQGVERHR